MTVLQKDGLSLYYTDSGDHQGEAIITLHGLSESGLYWTLPGITDRLVRAGYRVINMDMRGHGLTTVEGDDKGYDVDTVAGDIATLADHLGLEGFHLLTHATGGIVGLRYAMKHSDRLHSIMATNTGSAVIPSDEYAENADPDYVFPEANIANTKFVQNLRDAFRGKRWEQVIAANRQFAHKNVFMNRLHAAQNPESAFAMYQACSAIGNIETIADFAAEFYNDYDPHVTGLRNITCPTLVLLGEYDYLFIKPAELVAKEVPNNKHVVLDGMGHMTAIEDPHRLGDELLTFLGDL